MPESKVWPSSPPVMSFKVELHIDQIEQLPMDKLQDCQDSSFMVQIEWKGSRRMKAGLLPKGTVRNCTSKEQIQGNGVISWNEGFNHHCKLKKKNSQMYRRWDIKLEVQKFEDNSKDRTSVVGIGMVDIVEFIFQGHEKSIKIPINCNIKGHAADAVLTVKLQFTEFQTEGSTAFTLRQSLTTALFSCTRCLRNSSTKQNLRIDMQSSGSVPTSVDSSTEEEPEINGEKGENLEQSNQKVRQLPSARRMLSFNGSKLSLNMVNHSKDGNRSPRTTSQTSCLEDDGSSAEAGSWEKKTVISRDGKMELITEMFFASIDQRNERAAGGNACTVLAAVIANWLHKNPNILPHRHQLDDLVYQGSLEWRKLCLDENHTDKFYDQRFDLETVLKAKVQDLSVITERSYIGFFISSNMIDKFEFLGGAMSFDSIWKELVCAETSGGGIYITAWNDHFFVLKIEEDAIYLIDTLGERLFEGCDKAYILKFTKESAIYRRQAEEGCQPENSNASLGTTMAQTGARNMDSNSPKEVLYEGMTTCKEYIKEFLAALPIRELQHDIQKGLIEKVVYQRLQIDFYYTVPCNIPK